MGGSGWYEVDCSPSSNAEVNPALMRPQNVFDVWCIINKFIWPSVHWRTINQASSNFVNLGNTANNKKRCGSWLVFILCDGKHFCTLSLKTSMFVVYCNEV
jgi:hypothetical protein